MDERFRNLREKFVKYGVKFNEPISIGVARAFEKKYNVKLPEELVLFYTEVCNGCEFFVIPSLKRFEDFEFDNAKVNKEFMLSEVYRLIDGTLNDEILDMVECGAIRISDEDSFNTIVVCGEQKGKMWHVCEKSVYQHLAGLNFFDLIEQSFDYIYIERDCFRDGSDYR